MNILQSCRNYREIQDCILPLIDDEIKEYFDKKKSSSVIRQTSVYYDLLKEYLLRDGKRIRPLLIIIAYLGYGGKEDNLSEVIRLSVTIELLHAAFLVQDDIIDNSTQRRGGPALHVACAEKLTDISENPVLGRDVSLILADVLLADTLTLLANSNFSAETKIEYLKIFSQTQELTSWGQILDIQSSYIQPDVNSTLPSEISLYKTAFYTLVNPFKLGYILAEEHDFSEYTLIEKVLKPLGMAFQVRDDIIGVFGNSQKIGKSVDSDLEEGKFTLLVQETLRNLDALSAEQFIEILSVKGKKKEEYSWLRDRIIESGALAKTREELQILVNKSIKEIALLHCSQWCKIIIQEVADRIKIAD